MHLLLDVIQIRDQLRDRATRMRLWTFQNEKGHHVALSRPRHEPCQKSLLTQWPPFVSRGWMVNPATIIDGPNK